MHGKTRKSLGMRRTKKYVGMTKDEVQHSRWAFYEVVKKIPKNVDLTVVIWLFNLAIQG
jgi:hypothetical protein